MKIKLKEYFKLKNIYAYLQGTIRYKIYYRYKFFKFLVPKYIWKQIEIRINSIDRECYNQGYCKMCGCSVTALQFANKACDGDCYPKMLSKKTFNKLLNNNKKIFSERKKSYYIDWKIKNDVFFKMSI